MDDRRIRPLRVGAVAAIALALVLGPIGSASAETRRVRAISNGSSFVWKPKARSILEGDTIRWKAVDGSHNIQSRGSNWSFFRSLPQGASVTRTFNNAGTYRYYCTIHGQASGGTCRGMCGRIVVS
jgi:plastocyanin